jgi:putative endonuclease
MSRKLTRCTISSPSARIHPCLLGIFGKTVGVTDPRKELGTFGESLVAAWYERSGFLIVDRNWRIRAGELDLVVAHQRLLVFCEVKTRSSDAFGRAAEAVTPAKQRRLRMLAMAWLAAHPDVHPSSLRFDVASLTGVEVEVITAAF